MHSHLPPTILAMNGFAGSGSAEDDMIGQLAMEPCCTDSTQHKTCAFTQRILTDAGGQR